MDRRIPPALAVCLLAAVATQAAPDTDYDPVYHPELTISRAAGPIDIDGRLDDPGWAGAARAGNFAEHQPGDQTKPPVDTEVLVAYDDACLYVAFVCRDDPAEVRASFCERDHIFQDDNVILCLDTFGDAATAYEIAVNPHGIQGDLFFSNWEDIRYDFIYHSAARITDDGWVAELAVPFSSLRFPNRPEQEWRVDFWRNHPREVRGQYSWAAYDRDESCWPCQWGTMRGIRDIPPGRGLEILPAFVAHQSGELDDTGAFDEDPVMGDASISGKYAVSSDLTVEATLNPDFSQVEADAAQVDVNTRFALFYDERRPFFQEGTDLFDTYFTPVYTRSINNPKVAAKVTGRRGRTSYALLSARDENTPVILPFAESSEYISNGRSTSTLLRVKQELGDRSYIGATATDRRYDGDGSGSLVGLDGRIRLNRTYQIEMQAILSRTEEPDDSTTTEDFHNETFDGGRHTRGWDGESFDGRALYASFERHGRSWGFDLDWWDRDPTFRAENGFETRNDRREAIVYTDYLFRLEESELWEWVQPSLRASRAWNHDGLEKDESLQFDFSTRMRKAQFYTHSQVRIGSEHYRDKRFADTWGLHTCGNATLSKKVRLGGSLNYGHKVYYGDLVVGRQSDCNAWIDWRPIDRVFWSHTVSYAESRHMNRDELYYSGYIYRSRFTLQLTRELSARLVVQYDKFDDVWDLDPLLTYRINPFSIFYIGSTRDYESARGVPDDDGRWRLNDRQYFMKLQYLFRI